MGSFHPGEKPKKSAKPKKAKTTKKAQKPAAKNAAKPKLAAHKGAKWLRKVKYPK